jgi:hypothetical protein
MSALVPSVISPALRAVPVTIIVILSAPAWLTWPFLSNHRQRAVLEMVDALARWTRGQDTGAKVVESLPETRPPGSSEEPA